MGKIVNKYLTLNPYFNDGRWISGSDLHGFALHSVGCSQPDPMVFWNSWNRTNYYAAGINGFIGEDVTYITAPCLETKGKVKRMPSLGKNFGNDHYIGFEMCEPSQIFYTKGADFAIMNKTAAVAYTKKVYANAVELFAKLCAFHGKDPLKSGVIISHNEGGKKGIASGHVDPEHLWKGLGLSYTMDGFRKDVKAAMGGSFNGEPAPENTPSTLYRVQVGAFSVKKNAEAQLAKIKSAGFTDAFVTLGNDKLYRVQVGAFSVKANADAYLTKVKKAGFSGFVTTSSGTVAYNKKSVEEIAREVIKGLWGSGEERKKRLVDAGYDYAAVQRKVNELL